LISWEEIKCRVRDGEVLLYDGLTGEHWLKNAEIYTEIYPQERWWPKGFIIKPYKINDRKVFGVLQLTLSEDNDDEEN